MNMPHYMFYAPGVTDAGIGGKPFSLYPFMLRMSPGRDDVTTIGPHKTTGFTQLSSDEPIKPTEKFSEKPVLHGDEVKDRGTAQESSRTMKPAAVAALDNC